MTSRILLGLSFIALAIILNFNEGQALLSTRILKGEDASPGEYPWMVSLRRYGVHFCGGAIIGKRHILTAAHCFVGRSDPPYTTNLTVVSGATKKHLHGMTHHVVKVTPHTGFARGTDTRWRHDIAVVELEHNIPISDRQQIIHLPTHDTPGNVSAILTGWGRTSVLEPEPNNLKVTSVSIFTNKDCHDQDGREYLDSQICGFDGKGTGFCDGDSGSPLVYKNEVVGIVSFAVSCGIGYPDIYTRVYNYLNFIESAM